MSEWIEAYQESARATKGIKVHGLNEPTALELARELNDLLRASRVSQKMHLARQMSAALVQKVKTCTTT